MLVCLCYPTSDAEIEAQVEGGARSLEEITLRCGAGGGCGACHCEIEEILEEVAGGATEVVAKPVGVDCPQRPLSIRSRPTSSREAA